MGKCARRNTYFGIFGLMCVAACIFAADTEPRWRELNKAARDAAQAKDYAKLLATLIEMRPLMPGNPRVAYNLAASEAMLGHREAALAALRKWAGMGLVYDVAADDDFASVRWAPEFRAIVERVAESRKAVAGATTAFAIAEPDFLPEDIA
jgi:hypothetical protein